MSYYQSQHLATDPSLTNINPFAAKTPASDVRLAMNDALGAAGDTTLEAVYNTRTNTVTVFSDRLRAAYTAERSAVHPFLQAQGRAESHGIDPTTSLISSVGSHMFLTLQKEPGSRIIVFADDSFIAEYNASMQGNGEVDSQLRIHLLDREVTGLSIEDSYEFAKDLASTRNGFELVSINNSQAVIKKEMTGRA